MLLHTDSLPPLLPILVVIAILMFKRRLGIPPNSEFSFPFSALILFDVSLPYCKFDFHQDKQASIPVLLASDIACKKVLPFLLQTIKHVVNSLISIIGESNF
ncbi:uncharacterized protein [Gossypium hirsutum]|uniref:Uncharacterized protein isoform X1 n=1 Tax=Gossypium hirsutum TaxID=3635 RepID=A0ABM3B5U7_GOSHI|nr:uncharacterized protein LOC121223819 isoform X1 [Gossypium hirsutum]